MRILQKVKKYKIQILVLVLILMVQGAFMGQKEGYHMDELLSFELSNAEYNPWIVPTQPVGRLAKFIHEEIDGETLAETLGNLTDTLLDVLQNRGNSKLLSYQADVYEEPVWITKQQFQDYVTTGSGDRFNYLSVYFNVKDDNHPPVHFMLLHTISSIFPGQVSPLMGGVINLATLIGCAILFMKLGTLLDIHRVTSGGMGSTCGMMAALLYGCSQGAIATTLLIRMYGVLTFFCMAFFYLHVKKWLEQGFDKKNGWLIAVTVLGFLTQYFFLFYCLVLAAVVTLCLFWSKRRREAWSYIRSMVVAAIIGVGVFPFSVSDVFSSGRGVEALSNLTGGLADFAVRIGRFSEILLSRCFGHVGIGLVVLFVAVLTGILLFYKKKEWRPLLAFFYLPVMSYFLLAAKMSPMYVDRYLMAIFPFVTGWGVIFICCMLSRVRPLVKIVGLWVIPAAVCMFHIFTYDGTYLYQGYEKQLQTAKDYEELSCICLYEGSGYYDNLLEFARYESTLLVTPEELMERKEPSDIVQLQEVIFLVKNSIPEDVLMKIMEEYQFEIQEVLVEDGACGDDVYLCRRIQ